MSLNTSISLVWIWEFEVVSMEWKSNFISMPWTGKSILWDTTQNFKNECRYDVDYDSICECELMKGVWTYVVRRNASRSSNNKINCYWNELRSM